MPQQPDGEAPQSRVPEAASALQAVEVGLFQDPVDLQVRRRVPRPGQVRGVAGADGGVRARDAAAGAAGGGVLRMDDAALAEGRLGKAESTDYRRKRQATGARSPEEASTPIAA